MLIGQKGAGTEKLKKELKNFVGTKALELNVREVKNIDTDATLVAQSIATQLEKRIAWRRAMKMAIQKAMKSGIKGIKVMVGGRLDGADIARSEHYQQGILPLHTIRSDIEYGFAEAKTTFGIIGVKCWICYGEIKGKARRSGEVTRASRPDRKPDSRSFDRRQDNRQGGTSSYNGDRKPRTYSAGYRPNTNAPQNAARPNAPRPNNTANAPRQAAPAPKPKEGGKS
jgi:small subunit ribosomal protein S3